MSHPRDSNSAPIPYEGIALPDELGWHGGALTGLQFLQTEYILRNREPSVRIGLTLSPLPRECFATKL